MSPALRRMVAQASRLGRNERGAIAAPAALVVVPLLFAVVTGVDYARIYVVQSRLQTAVDAAALARARAVNPNTTAEADATAIYYANLNRRITTDAAGKPVNNTFLGTVGKDPAYTVTPNNGTISVKGSVTLGMSAVSYLTGTKVIEANATVRRGTNGMELALVLDVTGSMKSNDNIGGLRTAAGNLIDILYGSNETVPNFLVSVVPYTATVNIGKNRQDWLAAGSLDQNMYNNTVWAGCVEARLDGQDMTDTLASVQPFRPYFWPSTLQRVRGNYVSRYVDASDPRKTVKGDNEWTPTNITETQQSTLDDNTAVGPNLGCPAFPILPLTAEKKTVKDLINSLQATFRGGTMGNLGLQIGWFTLSPTWSGKFGRDNSPLPYNTPKMDKVVVMMTDGNNEWYDWPGGAPGSAPNSYVGQTTDADYTAYGRLSENRLGIPVNTNLNARDEINRRTATLCTRMKAAGITIYTVVLGSVDDSTKSLWQGCASENKNYFNSPDKAALQTAFSQIATNLSVLRITQ